MLKIITKADLVLLVILIILGLAATYAVTSNSVDGSQVKVSLNGKAYGTYSLNENKTIVVRYGDHFNKITIKDGRVQMEEASCKNQVCVHHSAISKTNENIVCLPNKVMVEIKGDGGDFDAVAN